MPTNRGEINFTSARIAATPAPRRRTCTCTSVAFTLAVLSWKRPQKNWRQSCKTNWALSCRGTPKMTTRTNNAVDYSGLQEWSLHVGLRLYYYFFKKTILEEVPDRKGMLLLTGLCWYWQNLNLKEILPYVMQTSEFCLVKKPKDWKGRSPHLLDGAFTELAFRWPALFQLCYTSRWLLTTKFAVPQRVSYRRQQLPPVKIACERFGWEGPCKSSYTYTVLMCTNN